MDFTAAVFVGMKERYHREGGVKRHLDQTLHTYVPDRSGLHKKTYLGKFEHLIEVSTPTGRFSRWEGRKCSNTTSRRRKLCLGSFDVDMRSSRK